jgi:aspartate-semialdehyde dehydrogenase
MSSLKIGICGATGAVGTTIISVLSRRNFPVNYAPSGVCIRCFASKSSVGKTIGTPYGDIVIQEFTVDEARAMDIVFLAVSKEFALHYAPLIAAAPGGAIVIDNSSAFRYEVEYPLCIPEINPEVARGSRIIANPNCTTAIAAVVLWPLHQKYKLKKIIVSSYQASSGAGAEGMEELKDGVKQVLAGNACTRNVFSHPLAFNVIPHIDTFLDNGYTKEEMKVAWETRKIFGIKEEEDVKISVTAVRVPTLRAHAEAITIETVETVDPGEARELLRTCAGVQVVDDPKKLEYPMPVNASTKFDVQVGRIRQSLVFGEHGLDLFVCGDQLLKGAALNAVQIAEIVK